MVLLLCVRSLQSVNFLDLVFLHLGSYTVVIINDLCKELCTKMFSEAFLKDSIEAKPDVQQ